MNQALLYDAVRTPFGTPVSVRMTSAHVIRESVKRALALDPERIDEVVFGNANGAGEENRNIGMVKAGLSFWCQGRQKWCGEPPRPKERAKMSTATSTITVWVEDPASRDRQLERATSLLREKATGCGILVTRVDYTTFTIALSPQVAYGQTREIDFL